jgi:hypothetical protein
MPDIRLPKNRADFLALVARNLGSAENDERVELPASWIRILLALAEKAPQAPSRPPLTMKQKDRDWRVIRKARTRKAELMAGGMRADEAAKQAAEEAFGLGRGVSLTTILRHMRSRK